MTHKTFKTGAMVALRPLDSTAVLHYLVTHSNAGAVQLWNGVRGGMESRPYLTQQPDGTWANGSDIRYTLEVAE